MIPWVLVVLALIVVAYTALRARRLRIDRDRISAELDEAYSAAASLRVELRVVTSDRDAIATRAAVSERAERRTFVRSLKRRAALVRVARHYRALRLVANAATGAGFKLGHQCNQRDAAIDAMTARIADLMPRTGCQHERTTRGASIVHRDDVWASEVCRDCGAFRTCGKRGPIYHTGTWRPASEYAEATAEMELD